jgi:hypothetical protein
MTCTASSSLELHVSFSAHGCGQSSSPVRGQIGKTRQLHERKLIKMFHWIIDLFLNRYNGVDFDTKRLHIASQADACRDAIADAEFRAQASNSTWDVQVMGTHSCDSSPYPENWHDSGME